MAFRAGGRCGIKSIQIIWLNTWMLLQHKAIGQILQGMIAEIQAAVKSNGTVWEGLQAEQNRLEASLKAVQCLEDEFSKEIMNEVLQTKTRFRCKKSETTIWSGFNRSLRSKRI